MIGPRFMLKSRFVLALPLLALALLALPQTAQAQAYSTAYKKADIDVFGLFTSNKPDYGQDRNTGMTFGADYTRYYHWFVAPSITVRAGFDSGPIVKQKTVLAGIRLKSDWKHLHPYGDFMVGGSWLDYVIPPFPTDTHDQGFTRAYGGGLDIDVYRTWGLRFDYQGEHTVYSDPISPVHLTPAKISGGVVYRIPFRNHLSHGYER